MGRIDSWVEVSTGTSSAKQGDLAFRKRTPNSTLGAGTRPLGISPAAGAQLTPLEESGLTERA